MNRNRIRIFMSLLVIMINVTKMNAQQSTASASLTLQQQSIAHIAASTATGNTDCLHKQLQINSGLWRFIVTSLHMNLI